VRAWGFRAKAHSNCSRRAKTDQVRACLDSQSRGALKLSEACSNWPSPCAPGLSEPGKLERKNGLAKYSWIQSTNSPPEKNAFFPLAITGILNSWRNNHIKNEMLWWRRLNSRMATLKPYVWPLLIKINNLFYEIVKALVCVKVRKPTWSQPTRQKVLLNPMFDADKRSHRCTNTFFLFLGISGEGLAIIFGSWNFLIAPIWNQSFHSQRDKRACQTIVILSNLFTLCVNVTSSCSYNLTQFFHRVCHNE
jgi:hypothetical protein